MFDFAALSLWIISSASMAAFCWIEYGQDFRGYYAAARVLLERENPYDYVQVARVLLDVTGREGNNPFYYPLWFGWFITPLSMLPFQAARLGWMVFNWAMWLLGLLRLRQLLDFPRPGWRAWLLNLLATFLFAWMTWKFEQTGILLFVIAVEILLAHKKQQWNRMGLFLALALIKPNVMLLPVAAIAAYLIIHRNWRPVLVAFGISIALILSTTALTPGWYGPFFRPAFGLGLTKVLDGPNLVTDTRLNTTLLDWLKWFGIPGTPRSVIYAMALFVAIWVLGRTTLRSKSILEVAVTGLLVSYAITPYALQYDFPPLAIAMFWALSITGHVESKLVPILVLTLITSVLIWERPISDGYWIVVGLSILAAWARTASGNRNLTPAAL